MAICVKATDFMPKTIPITLACAALLALAIIHGFRATPEHAAETTEISPNQPSPVQTTQAVSPPSARGAARTSDELNRPADISALLQKIRHEPDPDRRNEAIQQFAGSVGVSEFRSMLDSLSQDSDPEVTELRTRLVRRWAEGDPAGAREWSLAQPEGPVGQDALEQVAIADSSKNMSQTTAWVMALPNGENEQAAKVTVGYEAARTDPVQALDLASTLPPSPQRDDLLVHAASQWSVDDSSNAVNWALSVTDPQLRDRLVSAVAVASAEQDPVAAATLAAQAIPPGQQQDRAVVSIVQRWAEKSPEQTAAWVMQFPETPLREAALQGLLSVWVGQNTDAAQTWISQPPNSESSAPNPAE
jgi:hypothetical protein